MSTTFTTEEWFEAHKLRAVQKALVHVREQAELTQTQMAEKLGLHQAEYNQLENGKRELKAKHAVTLERQKFGGALWWLDLQARVNVEAEQNG